MSQLDEGFEIVHTMDAYYDGPRSGIADYRGTPHYYESQCEDMCKPRGIETFLLTPVKDDLFKLAMESWNIWLRWESAFHAGQVPGYSHPALPNEKERYEQIEVILKSQLKSDPAKSIRIRGEFKVLDDSNWDRKGFAPLQVKWTRIDPQHTSAWTSNGSSSVAPKSPL